MVKNKMILEKIILQVNFYMYDIRLFLKYFIDS